MFKLSKSSLINAEDKMTTKTGAENIRWDLSLMYSDLNDPKLGADTNHLVELMKSFNATHRGNLSKNLGQAILDFSEIRMLSAKIEYYLFFKQSIDVADEAVKTKMAEVSRILEAASGEYLEFFNIELVALDESILLGLYEDNPLVAKHRPWIEHIRVFKPHFLSEQVESALTKRASFGPNAWEEFFDELASDLEFELGGEKKTLEEMIHAMTDSKSAEERFKIMTLVNKGLGGQFSKYSAQTLYMVAGSNGVEVKERSYLHPMESANKSNRIPDSVVDALHRVVKDVAGPLSRRFYRLKAAHLGLKTLNWSDRNAPMPFKDTSAVPFDEAIRIVLEAYQSFSPTLAGLVRDFIRDKRIDAPPIKGRRGGAYNASTVLPGNKPISFTFLNYHGSNRDVMILAHELGHGVHGILSGRAQGPLMAPAPIAYCEFASTFGEMTTYNSIRDKLIADNDTESMLALVMDKIDDTINTTVRQIGFSNFERRLHGIDETYTNWGEPKKMSVGKLNKLWIETLKPLYGEEGEIFTYENADFLWSYINHFHRPFYVYGYSFGELCTQSLYAQQFRLGDRFEPLYLDLLRSGGTKNVVELLEPFGLDPAQEDFWVQGIKVGLGAMLEQAEELSRKMGVSID
ncbi:MAG: hypothetical protein HYT62_00910 [Candidatus Yanofskybacteria bacterium]|nr:hypothetical protein [Candidatus Yanofskybacteria bacterium]